MLETAPVIESGFAKLGLDDRIVEALTGLGYTEPTPIQREAVPPLLAGRDLIGRAETGTGKTAAFTLPLLHRLAASGARARPAALILVPTRELAMQVAGSVERYGRLLALRVLPIYGGQPMEPQLRALDRGVDVIVATPGRALDHLRRGSLKLDGISVVVLDEADEMLDMGFAEDLDALLAAVPSERQTMLFSATMAPRIRAVAGRHLKNPVEVVLTRAPVPAGAAPRVRQTAYLVPRAHKLAALGRVLDAEAPTAALIFCQTRSEVDELTEALAARGYRPEALHGGMAQDQRDRVMRMFRSGKADLLVATDVAARGLDVEHLTHVVNYRLPLGIEAYVHRIGRVGRAGREGVAITVAEPREQGALRAIERVTGQRIELARVPTAADLRARRLERTEAAIRATITEGGLDPFKAMLASLSGEFDPADIALAALKIAHREQGDESADGPDIPVTTPEPARPALRQRNNSVRSPGPGLARIFISAGREAGISPRDLVGAIANEAGLPGRDIKGIEITERFSIVEVPEDAAEHVIESMNGVRLRGRRVNARRDRQN